MHAIKLDKLTKRYGKRLGIDAIDLTIPNGAVFGFLGPNGAGKTTTIRLLLGLLRPSSGHATVLDMNTQHESPRIKDHVGYIPGDLRLYPWMTARNALRIVGRIRHKDLITPGRALCERFDLEEDVRVRNMSRGMRQKLGLVLALAHEPKLLILDEPTTALDPTMQRTLYACLRERTAAGATVFFSSHTLSEVEGLCDRVAILRKGKLIANEPLEILRERAGRIVTLRWRDEHSAQAEVPNFLTLRTRNHREWIATLSGPSMDLVHWAAQQPLEDMTLGKPDLDSLFHTFYEDQADAT